MFIWQLNKLNLIWLFETNKVILITCQFFIYCWWMLDWPNQSPKFKICGKTWTLKLSVKYEWCFVKKNGQKCECLQRETCKSGLDLPQKLALQRLDWVGLNTHFYISICNKNHQSVNFYFTDVSSSLQDKVCYELTKFDKKVKRYECFCKILQHFSFGLLLIARENPRRMKNIYKLLNVSEA